jgi:hypothetical protein
VEEVTFDTDSCMKPEPTIKALAALVSKNDVVRQAMLA